MGETGIAEEPWAFWRKKGVFGVIGTKNTTKFRGLKIFI
jgi:hypothetical protein